MLGTALLASKVNLEEVCVSEEGWRLSWDFDRLRDISMLLTLHSPLSVVGSTRRVLTHATDEVGFCISSRDAGEYSPRQVIFALFIQYRIGKRSHLGRRLVE